MAVLTDEDFKAIEQLFDVKFDEKLDAKFKEQLSHLPTKDEFYNKMD